MRPASVALPAASVDVAWMWPLASVPKSSDLAAVEDSLSRDFSRFLEVENLKALDFLVAVLEGLL